MTYQDKLKDPRWQKKRLEIMQRDEWRCTQCGDETQTLHVHHAEYRTNAEPWEYPSDLLATLCETCHKQAHGIGENLSESVAKLLAVFHVARELPPPVPFVEYPSEDQHAQSDARRAVFAEAMEASR